MTMVSAADIALARRLGDGAFVAIIASILAFLYLPVVVLIIFSFNDSSSLTLPLSGFTLKWYQEVFANGDLLRSLRNSFYVATLATAVHFAGSRAAVCKAIAPPCETPNRQAGEEGTLKRLTASAST